MANSIHEGILLVDKPKGFTSFDIVAQTRRSFKTKAVGHTGTLDPFATGLLVLLLGRYTRLCEHITAQDKTYEAEICFGIGTDTDDCEGQVIATGDTSHLTPELINTALESFLGDQLQVPPQYSAISIGGERAYKKARRGEHIELPARPILVYEISPISTQLPLVSIRLHVSKGTYIRAIARDLGAKLGVPAHLTNLRRTASGSYDVSECSPELKT
ncbi:MAG: tRNA pseudouridine(55) synthase TruB, partial [Myxococcaceae bacterium]